MRIETEKLTYSYGDSSIAVHALNQVSLAIEQGEFFGVIGQTGSGKSTFVQHLNGLIKVQKNSGRVLVGDIDLSDKKCDLKGLRAKVGMVFQYPEYQLFAETVFDDVAFGIKNFMPEVTRDKTEQMVKDAITLVGLDYDTVKDKSPFELSGGQKRRVAIAGVIVTRPEVLVLDEPVAGLDPVGKREFIALLHNLHNQFVKTVVIISHDMNIVAEHCTSVAVFNNGEVIARGKPSQVFSDKDTLFKTGLLLPTTANVCERLKEKGVNLDCDFTEQGFIDAVVKEFGGNE